MRMKIIKKLAQQYQGLLPERALEYGQDPEAPVRLRVLLAEFGSWPKIRQLVKNCKVVCPIEDPALIDESKLPPKREA